jgi:hypothetical protein
LAGFEPALNPPSEEEHRIAEQFSPRLYADSLLVQEERKDLARNLGIAEAPGSRIRRLLGRIRGQDFTSVTTALALFRVGRFPADLTGARLGVLGVNVPTSEFPWDKEMARVLDEISARLQSQYAKEYLAYLERLFDTLFPTASSPTCVLKYRVSRDAADPDTYCIQYFAYWPIQLFPRHFYDYEPIYVLVRKDGKRYEPRLVAFNASFGASPLVLGKRPGHQIRTFINWDSEDLQITPEEFNPMADYMTKAYAGSYHYQPVPSDRSQSHTNLLIGHDDHPALLVPKKWHSYALCSVELQRNGTPLPCELHPLKTEDLLHIGWSIRNPFQAPFLYPTVGDKNALMHFPLTAATLWEATTYRRWSDYALYEFHIKYGVPSRSVSNIYAYQVGLFLDIFSELSGESMGPSMWPLIEARERELEGTLSLIRRLKRPKK